MMPRGGKVIIGIFLIYFQVTTGQEKVSFYSSDSLKITADLYLKDYNLPFILLFHQGDYSRGEYIEIAPKLLKLDYNCLAVDLRSGNKVNYITNETAKRALEKDIPATFYDAGKDIEASIKFVQNISRFPVILFGSSYSASLCLLDAKENNNVKAVIACSPGEYFRPEIIVRERVTGLRKPVFITATNMEYEYVTQISEGIDKKYVTIVTSSEGKGVHGAKAFWESSGTCDEYWLQLIMFFKKLKYD